VKKLMSITARVVCAAMISNLLAWATVPAQTPAPLPAGKIAKIEAAISAVMSSKGIPGLSIAADIVNQ
jgi:hypothetical protein